MCNVATAVDAIVFDTYEEHQGIAVIVVPIDPNDPYAAFKKLPNVVEFNGKVLGKTGYNSDLNQAYYRSDSNIARVVRAGR